MAFPLSQSKNGSLSANLVWTRADEKPPGLVESRPERFFRRNFLDRSISALYDNEASS